MNPTILQMQQDLEKFRANKMGTGTSTLDVPNLPTTSAPEQKPISPIEQDLNTYRKNKRAGTLPKKEPRQDLGSKLSRRVDQAMKGYTENFNPIGIGSGRLWLRQAGAAGGAVGDIVGAGIKALPGNVEEVIGEAVSPIVKPVMDVAAPAYGKFKEKFPGVAQDLEDVANATNLIGIGALKKPVASVVKNSVPDVGSTVTKHFVEKNKSDVIRPTTVNEAKYSKATSVYNDAKNKGINLDEVAADRGIIHDKLAQGGTYNTLDEVENLREGSFRDSERILRPALAEAEPSVRRLTIPEIRKAMITAVDKISDSSITAADQQWMKSRIMKEFADDSASASKYKNGFTLTNLHDNRIAYQKNGKYKIDGTALENRPASLSRLQGRVFAELLDNAIPEGLPAKAFRKELEKNFLLSNYLEALHTKRVPEGITKKAVRLFGRAITATVGGKIGGFPGSILGAQYGDMLFSTFETLPNPVKNRILKKIEIENPAVYKEIDDYIKNEKKMKAGQKRLPGIVTNPITGKKTEIRATNGPKILPSGPRLFATPNGTASPVRQEVVDMAAVEKGIARRPFTSDPRWQEKVLEAQENLGAYLTPAQMQTIKMGGKAKIKINGRVIDIDANDLPKVFGPDLKNPPEAYIPEDKLPVIDFGKPKPKIRRLNDIYLN